MCNTFVAARYHIGIKPVSLSQMATAATEQLLKKWLPRGYATKIAADVGSSPAYVRHVRNGHKKNDAILLKLANLARANRAKTRRTHKAINAR